VGLGSDRREAPQTKSGVQFIDKLILFAISAINPFGLSVRIAGRIIIYSSVPAPNGDRYKKKILLIGTPVTYPVT
jgi:hypothetical protein